MILATNREVNEGRALFPSRFWPQIETRALFSLRFWPQIIEKRKKVALCLFLVFSRAPFHPSVLTTNREVKEGRAPFHRSILTTNREGKDGRAPFTLRFWS